MKTPIEILSESNPTNIDPHLIGIFPPIITDNHLRYITKSGYHVSRSDTNFQCVIDRLVSLYSEHSHPYLS
jgi:hypothetical protein